MLSPLTALQRVRPALDSSELPVLVAMVQKHLPHVPAGWLDVGSGTGMSLRTLIKSLPSGSVGRVTAVDPEADPHFQIDGVHTKVLCIAIEQTPHAVKFDWVNCRHSLYYVDLPSCGLGRLVELLAKHGCLSITMWSRSCILYRLHVEARTALGKSASYTVEDLHMLAAAMGLTIVEYRRTIMPLRTDIVTTRPTVATALFDLCLREKNSVGLPPPGERAALMRDFLSRHGDHTRVNGILILRKTTQPQQSEV